MAGIPYINFVQKKNKNKTKPKNENQGLREDQIKQKKLACIADVI